jgi:hypothetical protein
MKRMLVAVAATLALVCGGTAWAINQDNPGGGGNYTTADTAADNVHSLVGCDVGGIFYRAALSGAWTQSGYWDGLYSNHILSVRFAGVFGPSAVCATNGGVFYSRNWGQSWNTATCSGTGAFSTPSNAYQSGTKVQAVGVAMSTHSGDQEPNVVAVAWKDGSVIRVAVSTDTGATFTTTSGTISNIGQPRKLLIDPLTHGTGRRFWVLSSDLTLWSGTNNGATWSQVTPATTTYVQDIALEFPRSSSELICATTSTTTEREQGRMKRYRIGSTAWDDLVTDANSNTQAIGAVFSNGNTITMVSVHDIGTDDGRQGIWTASASGSGNTAFTRVNDGSGWDNGWTQDQKKASRGVQIGTSGGLANTINKAIYWTTASFLWRKDNSNHFVHESTQNETGPYHSNGADNVNCLAMAFDSADTLWAGFYDIGLWKRSPGGGWTNMNWPGDSDCPATPSSGSYPMCWTSGELVGGNVNSMAFDGSGNLWVTECESSKSSNWDVYKHTSSGWTTAYGNAGGLLFRSLAFDGGTHMWVARIDTGFTITGDPSNDFACGRPYWVSTSGGEFYNGDVDQWLGNCDAYTIGTNPTTGTVLAGGPSGIYRSVDALDAHAYWALVEDYGGLPTGDVTASGLHTEKFNGVHQFYYDTNQNWWYAAVYLDPTTTSSGSTPFTSNRKNKKGGVLISKDDGQTWTALAPANTKYRYGVRSVAVDSCGFRVWASASPEVSGPVDKASDYDSLEAMTMFRLNSSGAVTAYQGVLGGNAGYRSNSGARVAINANTDDIYLSQSGTGVMFYGTADPGDGCGIQRPFVAQRPRVEATPAPIGRRVFFVQEAEAMVRAGALELYDVSGRRARDLSHGLYFSVERNRGGTITARHLVLVRR